MNRSIWRSFVAFGAILLLTGGIAVAQENTGNVFVKVTDTEGNPLPGVSVEISALAPISSRSRGPRVWPAF